jgi:hypothetical protein
VTRRWCAIGLIALVGGSLAACSDDGPGEGEARLEVDGEALVERAGGDRETVDDSTDLGEGDRVSMSTGQAVMRLAGGTTFELREGLGDADGTTLLMADRPVLEAGDLLVTTPGSVPLEADGTEVVVREGAARLTRAFGMSASAYDADVELDSAGVALDVPALRQAAVPDLGRPRPARPVDYDESDPWDRRYLGAAMSFDDELERLADDLTSRLPEGEGRTIGFLRLVLPGLEDEAGLDDADISQSLVDRRPGDNVIGAAITDLGERGSFEERWADVFGFRDEGAAWGIVALDQAVRSEPVLGTVEQAFDTSFDEVVAPPTTTPTTPTTPVEPGGGGDRGATGGSTDGGDGGDDGGTDGGTPPPTEPTTPTIPPIVPPPLLPTPEEPVPELAPVVEPVVDLVADLLGGLLG